MTFSYLGGPTDDRHLRLLSSGEHVFTADDVRDMGGQGAVYAFRHALQTGKPSERERNIGLWMETGNRLGISASGSGKSVVIERVVVQATPNTDEDAIAEKVVRKIERRLG